MTSGSQAPADPPAATTHAGGNGTGRITDAWQPFTDALASAARTAGQFPAGDPRASNSVHLGWLLAGVLAGSNRVPLPVELIDGPNGFKVQAAKLESLAATLKLDASPERTAMMTKLSGGASAAAEAKDWEPEVIAALSALGMRYAKAYALGRQLGTLAAGSQASFSDQPTTDVLAALDDLSSLLPPHAGRGVANSIRRWQAQPDAAAKNPAMLAPQCELWRVLLVGEKHATELLEPQNYLDAAERLGAKLQAIGVAVLRRYAVWVGLIAFLFVAGVVALLVAPGHPGTTAAGLSGVLAAVGLSWKGVGGMLGRLTAKLEAPLWGAEVDGAVTDAVTLLHEPHVADTGDYADRARRVRASAFRQTRNQGGNSEQHHTAERR
jgi:hypothetical protein